MALISLFNIMVTGLPSTALHTDEAQLGWKAVFIEVL